MSLARVAAFLKLRDEELHQGEADDEERAVSAALIVALVMEENPHLDKAYAGNLQAIDNALKDASE